MSTKEPWPRAYYQSRGGSSPANALPGYAPRDFCDADGAATMARAGTSESSQDTFGAKLRVRLISKQCALRAVVEERVAVAGRSQPQQLDAPKIEVGDQVDLY